MKTMKTKIILLSSVIMIIFTATGFTQTNDWEIFNSANSPIPGNSVLSVECNGNTGWIGTTSGVSYFNGTQWTVLDAENSGLPNNYVNDIAREQNGAIWFATDNGLARLYDHEWTVFNTTNSGLPVNIIKCINIDNNGAKWIGTWGGGLVKFDNTNWTLFNTSNSQIPGNGINSVSIDKSNNIWAGTFNNGIGVYNHLSWTIYNTDNSPLQKNDVKTIVFDKYDNAWIGTGNGIYKKSATEWTLINSSVTGFPFEAVNDIVCAENTWFATDHGIIEFDGNIWKNHDSENSSIPVNDVRAIDMDSNNNLWIATAGGGLVIFNSNGVMLSLENISNSENSIRAYPNPANGEVTFSFNAEQQGNAELALYDLQGKKVCTVLNEQVAAGKHQIKFNTDILPSGVYIWWVKLKDRIDTMKLAVI